MRPRIYISGPLTNGETLDFIAVEANVRRGAEKYRELVEAGFAPVLPHLTWKLHHDYAVTLPHQTWIDIDLAWIACSDAVLRLPGESRGSDMETEFATERGIPVFYDIQTMIAHFAGRGMLYD